MRSAFDEDAFYASILKGDLCGAMDYVKVFPEQADIYRKLSRIFEQEVYRTYEVEPQLNAILLAYQQYFRDVFYLGMERERAEDVLKERLAVLVEHTDAVDELWKVEEGGVAEAFRESGWHFLGGRTSGYRGPYIWKTTETVTYSVELPDGIQDYSVKLLDGFLIRSWIDYLSLGKIGPGGWTDADGIINCVKASYDLESENFKVSLLKHEAQHAYDLQRDPKMSSADLEYRAKLVELIYSTKRNLLHSFLQQADDTDPENGHAVAAAQITDGFSRVLHMTKNELEELSIPQIQETARLLFQKSGRV